MYDAIPHASATFRSCGVIVRSGHILRSELCSSELPPFRSVIGFAGTLSFFAILLVFPLWYSPYFPDSSHVKRWMATISHHVLSWANDPSADVIQRKDKGNFRITRLCPGALNYFDWAWPMQSVQQHTGTTGMKSVAPRIRQYQKNLCDKFIGGNFFGC